MKEEVCPFCKSAEFLESKLILLNDVRDPEHRVEKEGGRPGLHADRIKPEYLRGKPLEQFVDGYFCTRCGKGFIPDHFLL